jgi:hypothetical protein
VGSNPTVLGFFATCFVTGFWWLILDVAQPRSCALKASLHSPAEALLPEAA